MKLFRVLGIARRINKSIMYDEMMISLYEKQMAARAALGARYICHPLNDVQRLDAVDWDGTVHYYGSYHGYDVLRVPAQKDVLKKTDWELRPDGSLKFKLRLVK